MRRLAPLLVLAAGCNAPLIGSTPTTLNPGSLGDEQPSQPVSPLGDDYAADEVFAVAWVTSGFAPGEDGHDEHGPAHGWMGLTPDQVEDAARITGLPAGDIEDERDASILGGAAVLDALRDELVPNADVQRPDGTWWEVLVDYAGLEPEWLAHDWATDVMRTLQVGLVAQDVNGDVLRIEPWTLPSLALVRYVNPPLDSSSAHSGTDGYPSRARFVPANSSNQSSRSGGTNAIERVVLHTTEGSYSGAISWFQNPSSDVSAHYVIRKNDGEVTQMVADSDKAWHACSNNNDTLGIEHEGASSNPSTWTPQMLDASARLTAWMVTTYNIPIDRQHIVGHGEIQPSHCSGRSDPGPHFPWDWYIDAVRGYAGSGAPPAGSPSTSGDDSSSTGSDPTGGLGDLLGDLLGGDTPSVPTPPMPGLPGGGPAPSIGFEMPRMGDTIGSTAGFGFSMTGGSGVELWLGPLRIGFDLGGGSPTLSATLDILGSVTLTAKATSAAGALLSSDSISVDVTDMAGALGPVSELIGGMTTRLTSDLLGGAMPEYVRYFLEGKMLTDAGTGSPIAVPSEARDEGNFAMDVMFEEAVVNGLLRVVGYNNAGEVVADGYKTISVEPTVADPGAILGVIPEGVMGTIMRLQTEATDAVHAVEYRVEGQLLDDFVNGETRPSDAEFALWHQFESWGEKPFEVRAFSESGALVDTWSGSIHVPSPQLELTWSGGSTVTFDADAPAGTDKVVIEANGEYLRDLDSGETYAVGPAFHMRANVPSGPVVLNAYAFDSAANLLDDWSWTVSF
jgi:hypothetical protein